MKKMFVVSMSAMSMGLGMGMIACSSGGDDGGGGSGGAGGGGGTPVEICTPSCVDDADCAFMGAGATCTSDRCVPATPTPACDDDTDCTIAGLGTCYNGGTATAHCGCTDNADCAFGANTCDTTAGFCVVCADDGDCGGNTPTCYNAGTGTSYCGCTDDNNCAGATPLCSNGLCVECVADTDCAGENFTRCITTAAYTAPGVIEGKAAPGQCGWCGDDAECNDGYGSTCAANGQCSCADAADCTATPIADGWACE